MIIRYNTQIFINSTVKVLNFYGKAVMKLLKKRNRPH